MKKERAYFTLIELLVVVAVIGILASLLLPGLARAKRRAQMVICLNNTKQMGMATQMYLGDYHGMMPRGSEGADYASSYGGFPNGYSKGIPFIHMASYIGADPLYPDFHWSKRAAYYKSSEIFRCPSKPYNPDMLLDYAVNSLHFRAHRDGSWFEAGYTKGTYPDEFQWPTRYIDDLGQTMLYAENNRLELAKVSGFYSGRTQFHHPNQLPWQNGGINLNVAGMRMMSNTDDTHMGKMVYTAFDGSSHTINLTNPSDWPSNNARLTGKW